MKVREVMRKKIYTITPNSTLGQAVEKMLKNVISGLVVIDENNNVVGIVSEKDVYRTLYPSYEEFNSSPGAYLDFAAQEKEIESKSGILVKDFMTTNVIKASADDLVMRIGSIMLAKNIHRFPVIDNNNQLIGVVTRGDIFRQLFKKYLKSETLIKKIWQKRKKSGSK